MTTELDFVNAFQAVELEYGNLAANRNRQLANPSISDRTGTYFLSQNKFTTKPIDPIHFHSEVAKSNAKEFIRNAREIKDFITHNPTQAGVVGQLIDFFVENPSQYPLQPGMHSMVRQAGELAFKAQKKEPVKTVSQLAHEVKSKRMANG